MIIENSVEFILSQILAWLAPYEAVKLPFELINTLSTITSYGVWIVGLDIMKLFVGSVLFWFAIQTP